MSANPQAMAQLLASQLSQPQQQANGLAVQQSGMGNAAANLIQKLMLMKALQGQPPQQQTGQPPPPQPNILGQIAAQPQAMQAQQMPGGPNV